MIDVLVVPMLIKFYLNFSYFGPSVPEGRGTNIGGGFGRSVPDWGFKTVRGEVSRAADTNEQI